MKGSLYIAVFAALCASLAAAASTKKDLYCPPTNPEEDVLYSKAENCSEFYKCNYGQLVTIPCQAGLYYCAENRWCDYPGACDYSGCTMHPVNTPEEQKPEEENNDNEGNTAGNKGEDGEMYCPPEVDGNDILYANPDDCNKFYQCYYGKLYSLNCRAGLYYCPTNQWCDYAENCDYSHCKMPGDGGDGGEDGGDGGEDGGDGGGDGGNTEDLYCPPTNEEVVLYPNSEDCSKFYQCSYGHLFTHQCQPGLYYCPENKWCDFPGSCDLSGCKIPASETVVEEEEDENDNVVVVVPDNGVVKNANGELTCSVEGALYANPENCNEFYHCASGKAFLKQCSGDLYYCAAKQACEYQDNCDFSSCKRSLLKLPEVEEVEQKEEETAEVEVGEEVEENNNGQLACDVHGALIANPDNCAEFFQCSLGRLYTKKCAAGLYFCQSKSVCDYRDNCDYSRCRKS